MKTNIPFIFLVAFFMSINFAYGLEWGINAHLPVNNWGDPAPHLDRVVDMHFEHIRLDLRWDIVEQTPLENLEQTGNWHIFDASIHAARVRGIKVLGILQAPPGWATTTGHEQGTLTQQGLEHWVKYVRAVVTRYGNELYALEIYNEPNLSMFYLGTVDQYVDEYLIPARQQIRALNSNIKITGPSLSNLMSATIKVEDFYKRLGQRQHAYQAATGQRFFDIITHHTYNDKSKGVVEEFTKGRKSCFLFFCKQTRKPLLKIFADAGFSSEPIWLTEFGWNTKDVTEQTQGQNLIEALTQLASVPRMQAAFVYHLIDESNSGDYGVLRPDYSPKPAYDRLRDRR